MTLADFFLAKTIDDYLKNISASHLARIAELQCNLRSLEKEMEVKGVVFDRQISDINLANSDLLSRIDSLEKNINNLKGPMPKDDINEDYRAGASSEITATCAGRLYWNVTSLTPVYSGLKVGVIEMNSSEKYPVITQSSGRLDIYVSAGVHVTPGRVLARLVDH